MPLNTIWILAAVCVLGLAIAVIVRWRHRHDAVDLGVMNDQWISEQRMSHTADPNR